MSSPGVLKMTIIFKKVLRIFSALFVFSWILFSCDVGLGESVDVMAPTVSISYPPASVVIRDGFLLSGSWMDDKGVFLVRVSVTNDDTGQSYGTYTASVGLFDLSWSVKLNGKKADGSYPFPDGKYTVDVVATDTSGRTSGTASRSFEIDNTAPVFVIKSPGTFSTTVPSKYGSIFKVNGSIAEAHTVKEMLLTIYDSNGNELTHWTETNVNTAGGTSVTFASYGSSNSTLAENYEKIYDVTKGGNQNFLCSIKLTDSAAVYDGSSSERGGNSTTELWLNDSIYGSDATVEIDGTKISADLLSKNAKPQYEIGDFLKIFNGTYTGKKEDAEKALKILNATKGNTSNTATRLSFTLNKDANPSFSFLGYSFDTSAYKNKASKSGAITVKGEAGLNETNFKPRDIKVYLVGPFHSSGDENPISSDICTAVYENFAEYAAANPSLVKTLYDGEAKYPKAEDCASVNSWTESLTLPDNIVSGDYYLLTAAGKDIDEVEFVPNNKSKFGFVGVSSGTAPSVLIEKADGDTKEAAKTIEAVMADDYNTLDFLKIYGTVESSDSQITSITYDVTVKDLNDSTVVGKITTPDSLAEKTYDSNKEEFAFDLKDGKWNKRPEYSGGVDATDISTLDGKHFSYTIVVTARDKGGLAGKANFTVQFDKLAPDVNITSVTPLAEEKPVSSVTKKCVNGVVTVVAKIIETNLDKVKVIATTKTGTANEKKVVCDVVEPASTITAKFDTRELDDCEDLNIRIEAVDKAGNTGIGTNTAFYIDQSTDIPKIKLSGVTQTLTDESGIKVGTNLFGMGNNTLYGTITDDDGLSEVKIYVDGTEESNLKKTVDAATLSGSTVHSLQEDFSKAPYSVGAGDHKIYIVVEDTSTKLENGVEVPFHCTTGTENSDVNPYGMAFAFDDDLPEISVTGIIKGSDAGAAHDSYSSGIWLPTDFIVKGTAYDPSGVAKVVCKDNTANPQTVLGADEWQETLLGLGDTSTGGAERTYVAYDRYGRSAEAKIVYNIDTKAPVFNKAYIKVEGSDLSKKLSEVMSSGSGLWFNATAIKLSGTVSNDTEQEEFGLVEANLDTIKVIVNDDTANPISVIPTVENGFSTNLSFQNSGTQKIEFSMTDKAGNESEVISFDLNVDADAPELKITSPASVGEYESAPLTFSGTVKDMNFASLEVQYKRKYVKYNSTSQKPETVNAGTPADNYVVTENITVTGADTSDAPWSWTMPGDGDYSSIKFIAKDSVGNTSVSDTYTTIVDAQEPVVSSTSDTSWTSNNSPSLKLLVGDWGDDGNRYSSGIKEITYTGIASGGTIDNRGALVSKTGETKKIYYTYTADFPNLEDGSHSVSVKVTDESGRYVEKGTIATFQIDTKAPVVTAAFSNGASTYQKKADDSASWYAVSCTGDDTNDPAEVSGVSKVYVTKDGTKLNISENSDGSSPVSEITLASSAGQKTTGVKTLYVSANDITEGVNTLTVTVEDYAGNKGTKALVVYYDRSAPKVIYSSHPAGAIVNKTISISGRIEKSAVVVDSGFESGIDTASTIVQSSADNSAWTDLTEGVDYTSVTFTNANSEWTLNGLDTTKLNDSVTAKDVYIRVVAADTYVNKSTQSLKLNVDQNADRPVIELSTITRMNDVIPLKKVSGTVTDDDGVSGLKMWLIESASWDGTSVPTASADNGWTKIDAKASGTWTAEADENDHSWLFYVIDANGGNFWTQVGAAGDALLSVPYLTLGSTKADNTEALTFEVDTQAPQITMYISNAPLEKDSDKWQAAGTVFGGTENKLYIKLEVVEQNMKTATGTDYVLPSLYIGTNNVSSSVDLLEPITVDSVNKKYTYLLKPITLDKTTYSSMQGSVTVKAVLADLSDQSGQGGTNIILDYTAPSVAILSPTATISDAVIAAVTVKGTVTDDYSSIAKLEYAIPLTTGTYDEDNGNWSSILASSAAWELAFTSGSADSSDSLLYYASDYNISQNKYLVTSLESGLGIYKVPVYFRVKDSVGNTAVEKDCYVYVDPNGGKPKAWINAPEEYTVKDGVEIDTVTSGVVALYGGASDNISVAKVCVQIDANGDGVITEADYTAINTAPENYIDGYSAGMLVASTSSGANDWYILAEGTNSWKCLINTDNIPAYSGATGTVIGTRPVTNGKKYLVSRVRAIDGDNNTRSYTGCHCVRIDNSVPWFTDLAVVQYGSGVTPTMSASPVTEREYISGMYISDNTVSANGKWYLTGYVRGETTITSISATTLSSTSSVVIDFPEVSITKNTVHDTTGSGSTDVYKLLIPLTTDSSGMIYAQLASANGVGAGYQTIKINIDSTAPGMYTTLDAETQSAGTALRLKSQSKIIGNDLTSNSVIENSDGYFTFGDNVIEGGSGLNFIAFYLKSKTRSIVYDPMNNQSGTSVSGSKTANSLYINEDGLAAFYVTGATRSTPYSLEHSSVDAAHVRVGGLVKIGGSYHTITAVSGTTVSFTPSASTSFTSAELIYAQVVDHQITEYFAYDSNDDAYHTLMNDDGDGMCETITQIGTTYQWTARVDSTNIPDGKTDICVVAMDNAGNLSTGSIESIVANNRPRMTKVFVGTDLNSSGKYDFDADEAPVVSTSNRYRTPNGTCYGEFNYYTAYNTRTGLGQSVVSLASNTFKVVKGLCIVPEFVGGNGSLKYILDKDDITTTANNTGTLTAMNNKDSLNIRQVGSIPMFGTVTRENPDGNTNPVAYGGTDIGGTTYYDFGGIEISQDDLSGVTSVKLTFWDETDSNSGPSINGQWATLVIPFSNMGEETNPPVPVIKPFYWNGSGDNSVLIKETGDSSASIKGHIELEGALPADSAYTSGLPKVSGKIKIEGTVYDNVLVKSISMNVFGSSKTVAIYASGTWSQCDDLPAGVVSFTAEDKDLSQNGHTVSYVAVIDTEKLNESGYPVGTNKTITISGTDWNGNTSTSGSTQTAIGALTDCYKMDVVPYVTEVVTHLSPFYRQAPSVYARTALGHYPVYEGETIQFVGYNLGTNKANVTIPGMSETALTSGTVGGNSVDNTIALTKNTSSATGAKSGSVSVTVNNIPALNNLNVNDAKGSYSGSVSDDGYANAYNRQPNGVNNNTLTDDLELDVWQFKNAAKPVSGGASYVTMKINPKTGIPGFSYANSILYFNMPGYNSDNNSSTAWAAGNKTTNGTWYSQIPFGMNYGGFSHNTFTFDSYGHSYGAAMCTDTSKADESAFFQFFSRETPRPISSSSHSYTQNMNYGNSANASRLDSSSIAINGNDSGWTTDIDRIQSISMDTSYSGGSSTAPSASNPVYVFMAYYDQPVKQVRFRWGTVGDGTDVIDGKKCSSGSNSETFDSRKTNAYGLDDVVDNKYTGYTHGDDTSVRPSKVADSYITYSYNNNSGIPIQVVAASGVSGAGGAYSSAKNGGAGKYVSLSIANKDTANPVAIVTWYDSVNMQLKMAYNEAPTTSNSWTVRVIDKTGGINVKTAVDKDNHIHFAYYDNINGSDLKYAYLDSYDSTSEPTIVTVDSFSAVGAKCTIDVAKDSAGNWVPYIGYQLSSYLGTPLGAKVAYRTDFSKLGDGATKERYTGLWECSIVPTQNIPNDDQINVGVYRNGDGYAQAFTSNTYWSSGDTRPGQTITNGTLNVGNPTILHGNNTANPIIGYGIDTGAIEMAQKK